MNKIEGHKSHRYENRVDIAGEHRWSDAGQLILVIIFILGLVFDLFIFNLSGSWQNLFSWYYRLIIFIPLFLLSGYFSQNGLKKVFKEKREKLEVIDKGVFGMVRHPIYLGSILVYLSFVILSLSIVALIIFVIIVIFYYYICRYEEKLLIQELGDKYRVYMRKVPMLIPKIQRM
jgi:protein-S-isoprenylcysteine O-methyltransferase Ste14